MVAQLYVCKYHLSTHLCCNVPFEHTLVLPCTICAHTRSAIYHLSTHSCYNMPFEHTLMLQCNICTHTHATIYHLSTHLCCNIPFEHTLTLQYNICAHTHAAINHFSCHAKIGPPKIGLKDQFWQTGPLDQFWLPKSVKISPDRFWLPKSVQGTNFGCQNWLPFAKNGPHAKLKVYKVVAQTIIYKALK